MNKSQQRTLNEFVNYAVRSDRHEVKELAIDEREGDPAVYIRITVGLKDDEGTMAEFFCRDTYMFFIGPRGGMFQYGRSYAQTYCNKYTVKTNDRLFG